MGIRIAHDRGIPVLNLGALHPRAVCERLEQIRAAPSSGESSTPDPAPLRLPDGSMP